MTSFPHKERPLLPAGILQPDDLLAFAHAFPDPIARIRAKVQRLAALDRYFQFAWQAKSYAFGPPVPEAELVAFEAQHGIRLPSGYRRFLAELGWGGGIWRPGDFQWPPFHWHDDEYLKNPNTLPDLAVGTIHPWRAVCGPQNPYDGMLTIEIGCDPMTSIQLCVNGSTFGKLWRFEFAHEALGEFLAFYESCVDDGLLGKRWTDFRTEPA